jgi:hypothetical protein
MGLTICYRGTLRNPNDIETFLEDVTDICMEIGWQYMPIHRSRIMPAQGVMITPAGSEPIWLTFLLNGNLYDPSHFIYTTRPELEVVNEERRKWIFTKTQYAGVFTHMAIIKFFRYLRMNYFEDFELRDESKYWETYDMPVDLNRFGRVDSYIDPLAGMSGLLDEVRDEVRDDVSDIENDDEFDDDEYDEEDEEDEEDESERMDEVLWRRGGMGMSLN